jgi:hypothetical protein
MGAPVCLVKPRLAGNPGLPGSEQNESFVVERL